VLEFATKAAISLNHAAVGAEHLLAGMLRLKSGTASAALKEVGITLPLLKSEVESAWARHDPRNPTRRLRYTPRCKGIIQRAQAQARDLGRPVEVNDLFLELLAEDEGLPARIFQKQAVDLESLKRAVKIEVDPLKLNEGS
jgi:ATP-dependent Clp protease ATP-binding subunit ClpA